MHPARTTHKTALRTAETPLERRGSTAVEQVNRDSINETNAVHSSLVQGQDRLAFSFTAKWQAEWKGAGSVGRWLSVTSYTSSHLPTHWHFTPKKKKIREASWLPRLRHQRCTCLAHWGLRPADLHFQAELCSARKVSHFAASILYKNVQQFEYHMVTAVLNNTEFRRK